MAAVRFAFNKLELRIAQHFFDKPVQQPRGRRPGEGACDRAPVQACGWASDKRAGRPAEGRMSVNPCPFF